MSGPFLAVGKGQPPIVILSGGYVGLDAVTKGNISVLSVNQILFVQSIISHVTDCSLISYCKLSVLSLLICICTFL